MKPPFLKSSYLLITILVIAAILRFNNIDQPFVDAFGWRQTSTAMMADNFHHRNWNILYPEISWNGPDPSYNGREFQTISYIAALLYIIVGQDDWVGRSVAVTFSLWGIFALYQLVRRVWSEKLAILSAATMALLPGGIFIDRSFIPDPVMVSLVVTSFWMLVAYLQTEKKIYLLLASLIGMWGFLTKITGLIVGIPMLYTMFSILNRKQLLRPRKIFLLTAVAIVTLIPVAAYYRWAMHLATAYPPYHFAGSGNWLWNDGIATWLQQNYFLDGLNEVSREWMWGNLLIGLIVLGLILPPSYSQDTLKSSSDKNNSDKVLWLFHWWFLGGVIYYLIGAQELIGNPWNFHILNPAVAAIVGHAIASISNFIAQIVRSQVWVKFLPSQLLTRPAITATLLLFIIATQHQSLLTYLYKDYGLNSYQLGLALNKVSKQDDLVVTIANTIGDPVAIYYSRRRGWVFPPADKVDDWGKLPEDDSLSVQLFEELRTKGADWFGIAREHLDTLRDQHPQFYQHLVQTSQLHSEDENWIVYKIQAIESTE